MNDTPTRSMVVDPARETDEILLEDVYDSVDIDLVDEHSLDWIEVPDADLAFPFDYVLDDLDAADGSDTLVGESDGDRTVVVGLTDGPAPMSATRGDETILIGTNTPQPHWNTSGARSTPRVTCEIVVSVDGVESHRVAIPADFVSALVGAALG